jgi:hypothetical protein|tara:strand:+ start:9517 stop:9732 length:216 start_codon:yes stop_codon:yes gene_type:complete
VHFVVRLNHDCLDTSRAQALPARPSLSSLAAMALASWSTVSGETKRILVAFFGFLTGDEPKVRISNRAGFC